MLWPCVYWSQGIVTGIATTLRREFCAGWSISTVPDLVIVHGGAPGVDWAFSRACRELDVTAEPHLADWKGLGNVAGPARNAEMVQSGIDLCVAFHRSIQTSKGTKDCVKQALAAGIAVYLIADDGGRLERVLASDARLK
jgi:hypothetical protein